MSQPHPIVVHYRGRPEFRAALETLQEQVGCRNLAALVDRALGDLAAREGVPLPVRCLPHGYNRYTPKEGSS